jgi:hypothetical protein
MALLLRIYFNAVFGALGGLLGWLLYGVFYDPNLPPFETWLLGGALIGGQIGYLVVGVEALRDLSLVRFCRLASYGVVLGALGGALGMCVAEGINSVLIDTLGRPQDWRWYHVVAFMLTRGLSWLSLGVAVGLSEGIAARSLGKLSYGTLGGALGGFLGGSLFGLFHYLGPMRAGAEQTWTSSFFAAVGLVILGACIGALSALVQGVLQPASLRVLRGWQEGREYALLKAANILGRDERADIALFRDMRIEKHHALIQRQEKGYALVNDHAPPEETRVNGEPVAHCRDLRDGDRIQLGNVVLEFRLRDSKGRGYVSAGQRGKRTVHALVSTDPLSRA